jgi:hypothetical protein
MQNATCFATLPQIKQVRAFSSRTQGFSDTHSHINHPSAPGPCLANVYDDDNRIAWHVILLSPFCKNSKAVTSSCTSNAPANVAIGSKAQENAASSVVSYRENCAAADGEPLTANTCALPKTFCSARPGRDGSRSHSAELLSEVDLEQHIAVVQALQNVLRVLDSASE